MRFKLMMYTDVCFDGIDTALLYMCACACVWAISNTFPQSLKHNGTASEQRWPDAAHSLYCKARNLSN